MNKKGPRLDLELVRSFVVAAHGDLAATREMLAAEPALVNATWDLGGGDWETALGGASHTGSRDVALFLLSQGARLDLFCAAMLGKFSVVRAAVEDDPRVVDVRGPHGITLMQHAVVGGQDDIVRFLESHGASAA